MLQQLAGVKQESQAVPNAARSRTLRLKKPSHLQATNPVYEEAEGAVQTPAAAEELTTVVENDAFVPTAPIQEDAGRALSELA